MMGDKVAEDDGRQDDRTQSEEEEDDGRQGDARQRAGSKMMADNK